MNGIYEYNNGFDVKAKKRIERNVHKECLDGAYNFMLADTSYSGAYGYLGCIINFLEFSDVTDLSKITVNTYTKYLSYIKGKSSSYRIMVYSGLKKFSTYLSACGICDDYMKNIKRPKFKESNETRKKREKGYMEPQEITKFINNVKSSNKDDVWKTRDLAMVLVLLNSGIRCSALYKLDTKDINLKNNSITVLEKGDNAREIFLSEDTMEILKDWLRKRSEFLGLKYEDAVFISNRKKRMSERSIYNMVKGYGIVIEDKNITPHKTRATFGTQLYNQTNDVYFVQECMGHSNPKTTELYIRGQKKDMSKKAANLMGNLIW